MDGGCVAHSAEQVLDQLPYHQRSITAFSACMHNESYGASVPNMSIPCDKNYQFPYYAWHWLTGAHKGCSKLRVGSREH